LSRRFVRLKRYGVGCMGSELSSTLEPETAAASGRPLPPSSRYIRLGPFQVDQHRQEVTKNGVRLKLHGKVYQVLLALIEKQGEVVTREEIRVRLWPADTHVDYDPNVNTTVNKLRQALWRFVRSIAVHRNDSSQGLLPGHCGGVCRFAAPASGRAGRRAQRQLERRQNKLRAGEIRSVDHLRRGRFDSYRHAPRCRD
jgi:hypothetical protein